MAELAEMKDEIAKLLDRGKNILNLSANDKFNNVAGIDKFRRKVKKELQFLEKLSKLQNLSTVAYVKCTNLQHLEALISYAIEEVDCISILQTFRYPDHLENAKKLTVDVVSRNGARWSKISARNPKALTLNSSQNSVFGVRSVVDQASDYLECGAKHPHLFNQPQIVFHFASGIEASLADDLINMGVKVSGYVLDDAGSCVSTNSSSASNSTRTMEPLEGNSSEVDDSPTALNLDVSTMMAYVSSSTNGGCRAKINSVILADQAKREQSHRVKEILDNLFKGNELLCCKTAEDDFRCILKTVAGIREKERAEKLLQRMTVVADNPSSRSSALKLKGRIKERSIIIFGTGDNLKIPTVTANAAFVRAAQHQGIDFVAFVHESRALTESKEVFE